MDMMEWFNVIAGISSIISLLISIFVASKVVKLSNSNNNNAGVIQTGDGVQKVAESLCKMITPGNANNYCFIVDFSNIISKPKRNRWIGYTIQSLPMGDWRTFVNENYALEFQYMTDWNIQCINLEITNTRIGKKLCRRKLQLSAEEQKFSLPLGKYIKSVEDWKAVNEICFVFFPEECVGQKGSVFITDVVLIKE